MAISASNEDDTSFDFALWLEKDVAPSKTSMDEVYEAVLEQGRRLSVASLVSNFPSLSNTMFVLASTKHASGDYEQALKVLDGHWELVVKAEAVFKFPREVVRCLALESQIHTEHGDLQASVRCNRILWKLLKQYEWIAEEREFESLRTRISTSLALAAALKDDCLGAEYFLGDAVHYARQVVVSHNIRDEQYAEGFARDVFKLLHASLQAYFYLKYNTSSKCKNTFKRSARAAYDVIFAVEPSALPHWKDLKRNIKEDAKERTKQRKEAIKRLQEAQKTYRT